MAKVVRYGREEMLQNEDGTSVDITTGMLLERANGGEVAPHSSAGSAGGPTLFARDHRAIGMELGDVYATDADGFPTDVVYMQCSGGSVNALVSAEVAVDDFLTSDGAGALRPLDTAGGETTDAAVAQVVEGEQITVDGNDYAPVVVV